MAGENPWQKRKRTVGSAADIPDIPGIPTQVVPVFVHALKVSSKFFQHATVANKPFSANAENAHEERIDPVSATSIVDCLMNRVEASTTSSEDRKEQEGRLHRMQDAVEAWLESVKRFVRNDKRKLEDDEPGSKRQSVPFSCFLYLWGMQQEHGRVAARRAALHLSGILLQKSRDCRFHLEQDTNLAKWVTNIVAEGATWKNPEQAAKQLPLLQQESQMLLHHLIEEGYDSLYPKIGVAQQRLRQLCPNLDTFSSGTSSMIDWRRLRDIALQFGEKEIQYVEKLVTRAHACLDSLVPRLGDNTTQTKQADTVVDDQEDEDDIDWEDGEDFDDGYNSTLEDGESHVAAVERTLAAMESTGAIRGGGLDIDFEKTSDEATVVQTQDNKSTERLKQCAQLLSHRHIPRLSAWVEGLTNADNLVLESSSLVLLPSATAQLRVELLERLLVLKRTVASVLSAAQRLEVVPAKEDTTVQTNSSVPRQAVGANLAGERRHLSLVSSFSRRRNTNPKLQSRSKRIQIKYRTS
jgi:hypothetical protein